MQIITDIKESKHIYNILYNDEIIYSSYDLQDSYEFIKWNEIRDKLYMTVNDMKNAGIFDQEVDGKIFKAIADIDANIEILMDANLTEDEDLEGTCQYCNGSGEGQYSGATCISCKGSGVY